MQIAEQLRPLAQTWRKRLSRVEALPWLGPLGREPLVILGPLLVAQWLALLALALSASHNGWLYYQGGDQTYYYTTAWLLSHWTLPVTPIGYGWSLLLAPIAAFAGPNVLDAMPAIVVLNAVILLPVSLLCVYGIAARIGGRAIGYLAALLWVAIPYAAIPLFDPRFHEKYVDLTLPQTLGFSGLADFPSTVCLLLAAYLVVRTLDSREWTDAVLVGLVTGFALGLKPSNSLFLFGVVLALLAARRWRELVIFGAALAPAVLTLAAWKQRGLGQLPIFEGLSGPGRVVAANMPVFSVLGPLHKYVHIDWSMLRQNLDVMREFFWSVRPLEWIPLAGLIAIARRSLPKALLVFGWFAAFLIVKGTDPRARVEDASFFRLMMPSLPAYVLLLAAVPLLVPTLGPALARRLPPARLNRRRSRAVLPMAGALLVLTPLPFVLGPSLQRRAVAVSYSDQGVFVPIQRFGLSARQGIDGVRLSWTTPYGGRSGVFYRVLRSPVTQPDPDSDRNPPVREGVNCRSPATRPGAADCRVLMATLGTTAATGWHDTPRRGSWSYRVGLSANWRNDRTRGDVLLLSEPVTVTVR